MNFLKAAEGPKHWLPIAMIFLALMAGSGNAKAQLGKPTYDTPRTIKQAPKKNSVESKPSDVSSARVKPTKNTEDLGVGGGSICLVDADLCPQNRDPDHKKAVR